MFQILVVEDDAILRELYCSVLSDNGYTPLPAADGLEAFDILDDHHVDLIITDVMMPRMDGFEFTRALREAGYTTPVRSSPQSRPQQISNRASGQEPMITWSSPLI